MAGEAYENLNGRYGHITYKGYDDSVNLRSDVTIIADSRPSLGNANGEGVIDFKYTDSDGWPTQKSIPAKAFMTLEWVKDVPPPIGT